MANRTEPTYAFEGLHHVQLATLGVEDSCHEFWRDILGMTEMEKPAELATRGGCWFQGGSLVVHLGVEHDFSPAKKAHPGLLISRLDGLAAHLHDNGVEVTRDDDFPGFARFYAHDPFGNRLEFLEQVGSENTGL